MSEQLSQLERLVRQLKHELRLEIAVAIDLMKKSKAKSYYRGRCDAFKDVCESLIDDITEHIKRTTKK